MSDLAMLYKIRRDEEIFDVLYQKIIGYVYKVSAPYFSASEQEEFVSYFDMFIPSLVNNFNANKGQFITYLHHTIKHKIQTYYQYKRRIKRDTKNEVNLDYIKNLIAENEDFDVDVDLAHNDIDYDFISLIEDMRNMMETDLFIIAVLRIAGYENREIASMLGITYHMVSNRMKMIRRILYEYVNSG